MSQTRISRDECKEVSRLMSQSLQSKIDTKEAELLIQIDKKLLAKVPKEVLAIQKKHPAYINKYEGYIRSEGSNIKYMYNGDTTVPSNGETYTLSKKVYDLNLEKDNLNIECKQFRREIESVLYSLRSFKKISENFPEAAEFLPKKENTAIVVSCQSIRDKFKMLKDD